MRQSYQALCLLKSLYRQRWRHISPKTTTLPDKIGDGTNSPENLTVILGNATLNGDSREYLTQAKQERSWENKLFWRFSRPVEKRTTKLLAFFYSQYAFHKASCSQLQSERAISFFFFSYQVQTTAVRIVTQFLSLWFITRRLINIFLALCKIISITDTAINFSKNYIHRNIYLSHYIIYYTYSLFCHFIITFQATIIILSVHTKTT